MTDDAKDDGEAKGDGDRAAILARRQRFIALALSGLAGAAACDTCTPKPCLNISAPPEPDPQPADPRLANPHRDPSQRPDPSEPEPTPHEDVAPDIEPARPHPCLNVVRVPAIQFTASFRPDAIALDDDAKQALDLAAEILQAHPEVLIEVAGHTDDRGSRERRMKLSLARAEAVREYLITKGIAAERMTVKAYGGERPLVLNDSDTNRAKNNRVELTIRE